MGLKNALHNCYGPGQTVTLDGSDQPMKNSVIFY